MLRNRTAAVLAALALVGSATQAAPLGTSFTYQGELRQAGIVVDQPSDFRFRLYDALAGGGQVGAQNNRPNVPVTRGTFTVSLDFGSTAFTGDARFLEIDVRSPAGVGGYVTLAPRVPLTSTPNALFAMRAEDSTNAKSADLLDGVDSSGFVKKLEANSVVASMITPNLVSTIDGVSNDAGNIDLVAGPNVSIVPNDGANTITISASADGGDAQTVDGLDSSQFLRADQNDSIADGTLYTVAGSPATLTFGGANLELNLGDSGADTVYTSGPLNVSGVLDAGNTAAQLPYHRIGTGSTNLPPNWAGSGPSGAEDLFVSGVLEVDDYLFADTIVVPGDGTGIFWETNASGVQSIYHSAISDEFVISDSVRVDLDVMMGGLSNQESDQTLHFFDGGDHSANKIRWDDSYEFANSCSSTTASGFVFDIGDNTATSWFFSNGNDVEVEIDELGNIAADGTVGTGAACDLAETFLGDADLPAGTVVRADPSTPEGVVPTTRAYDPAIVGVVSTRPGFLLSGPTADAYEAMADLEETRSLLRSNPEDETLARRQSDLELALETWARGDVAVALAGRVPVRVVGPVKAGEPLTSSHVTGHAMAMTEAGPSIGIALESKAGEGRGTVVVLAQAGWRHPVRSANEETREDAAASDTRDGGLVELRERIAALETQVTSTSEPRDRRTADGRDGAAGSDGRSGDAGRGPGGEPRTITRLEKEAWGDFDADGADDVLVLAPAAEATLLRNLGDGRFDDVTATAGLGATEGARIALWEDVDGDRRLDLLMVGADGAARLLLGDGTGRFADVTRAHGLDLGAPIVAATFVDHDRDGRRDLRVELADGTVLLHHNLGNGTFETTRLREALAAPADRLHALEEENATMRARLAEVEALLEQLVDANGSDR
ncbi:MAG: FG-GAP-like repeat-containing protein [Planctomycetota bacterium JB042]